MAHAKPARAPIWSRAIWYVLAAALLIGGGAPVLVVVAAGLLRAG